MTDLTDRMRTCAARIAAITDPAKNDASINDAVDLLIEASNLLEAAQPPIAAPVEPPTLWPLLDPAMSAEERSRIVTESYEAPPPQPPAPLAYQHTTDHSGFPKSPNACPQCDSRAAKTVRREGRKLMLHCPVCAAAWEWKPKAQWT